MDYSTRIERILEHAGGEWTLSDFMQLIESKKVHVLEYNHNLVIVEVQAFPQKRVLHIWGFEGDGALETLPSTVEWAKDLARSLDCVELRCQGRKGWERALRAHGASVLYTTLSMDV